jgi:glycosyltransferase involved in cell wall biosynthesis
MKILSLVWFRIFPAKYGGQKGIALFHKYLSEHTALTCLCSADNKGEHGMPFTILPHLPASRWQLVNPLVWWRILRTARKEKANIILLEHPYHAIAGILCRRLLGTKLVLHQHNIEYLRFKELGKWWWPVLQSLERMACRTSHLVFFKTAEDIDFALLKFNLDPGRCALLPYGVEREERMAGSRKDIQQQYGLKDQSVIILFAGTLDYEPNAEAVASIYRKLAPQLEALNFSFRILICGRNKFPRFAWLHQLQHPSVTMVGEVDDIRPYLDAADVFIDPVLSGGGIQTKILDALARHCTVVSFEHGATGIDQLIVEQKLVWVEDGAWKDFAAAIRHAAHITTNTPEAFFKKYSWETIAGKAAAEMKRI